MSRFFVGTLQAQGRPDQPVAYYETVHGPVIGYATVAGKRVAITLQRSTRGREILSAKALTDQLASLMGRSDDANSGGSSYISDWYGYVDKDLRTLLGQPVRGAFSRRYCGAGVLATCRDALWNALDQAAATLEATQGPAPSTWRADATAERIRFTSGVLTDTMRWTNRSTFQQLMTFSGHRPRR